jgi:YVTN family beta-propeller protein
MTLRIVVCLCLAAAMLTAAATPSPALIVLNKEDATLVIVDPASGKIAATIPVGAGPHEVAVSSDGKLALVGNYGAQTPGNTISVIDLIAQKELHRIDLVALRRPHGVAYADGKFYFTAEVNKLIARYDPATNQIDWMLGTGQNTTHMVLLSKDASKIYTANIGSDSISIIERAANGNWNQTVVGVGKGPEAMDLSPDGREIWTSHSRDGGVSIIDIATKKVTQTLSFGTKRSNRLKFTPDGKHVLISDLDAGELVVLDVATRKEIKRIKLGKTPEGILIVPDGSRAYLAVNGDNTIAVLDLKTWEIIGHLQTGTGPDGMAWAERK